jgi:hypothetical protein
MEGLLAKIWARPVLRYLFVVFASAFSDFWTSFYFYAIAHKWIVAQAAVGFCIPFINLVFAIWFIETKDMNERLKLTLFSALGMTIGATLMLLVV